MFETIDNRTKLLGDDLKKEIESGNKVRVAASCFSMYAFNELKEELSKIKELEFIYKWQLLRQHEKRKERVFHSKTG